MYENFSALILAAGLGKRMKSEMPKVLSEICGKSLLEHVISGLNDAGVKNIGIVTGYKGDTVRNHIGSGYSYYNQEKQLGTAHAVMCAKDFLTDGPVIILCGDAPLIDENTLRAFMDFYCDNDLKLAVLTANLENPLSYGRIIRENGSLKRITEKKDCTKEQLYINEVNSGAYIFDAHCLLDVLGEIGCDNNQNEYYLTDAVELFIKNGLRADAYMCDDPNVVLGANTLADLSECERLMRKKINERHMLNGVKMIDPNTTYIDAGVVIGAGTTLYPNTIINSGSEIGCNNTIISSRISLSKIGSGNFIDTSTLEECEVRDFCRIGPYAHLRPKTLIKNNVKLGNFVEVKNSIIDEKSSAAHLTYVGDGEIGKNVNLGCGVVFANYDGVNKHKTVIGDESFIGCNTNLIAPVKIGSRVLIAAGSTITKDLEDDTFAIARCKETLKKRNKNNEE